jgi:hypothetical protein
MVINLKVRSYGETLLSELAQTAQHLRRQFTTNTGCGMRLDDCIEQLVDLLQHFYALLFVLLDCL